MQDRHRDRDESGFGGDQERCACPCSSCFVAGMACVGREPSQKTRALRHPSARVAVAGPAARTSTRSSATRAAQEMAWCPSLRELQAGGTRPVRAHAVNSHMRQSRQTKRRLEHRDCIEDNTLPFRISRTANTKTERIEEKWFAQNVLIFPRETTQKGFWKG